MSNNINIFPYTNRVRKNFGVRILNAKRAGVRCRKSGLAAVDLCVIITSVFFLLISQNLLKWRSFPWFNLACYGLAAVMVASVFIKHFAFSRLRKHLTFSAIAAVLFLVSAIKPLTNILDGLFAIEIIGIQLNMFTAFGLFYLLVQIIFICQAKRAIIDVFDDGLIRLRSGFFFTQEMNVATILPLLCVSVYRPFWGSIFGFGNITLEVPGMWHISVRNVVNPDKIRRYLEAKKYDVDTYNMLAR